MFTFCLNIQTGRPLSYELRLVFQKNIHTFPIHIRKINRDLACSTNKYKYCNIACWYFIHNKINLSGKKFVWILKINTIISSLFWLSFYRVIFTSIDFVTALSKRCFFVSIGTQRVKSMLTYQTNDELQEATEKFIK